MRVIYLKIFFNMLIKINVKLLGCFYLGCVFYFFNLILRVKGLLLIYEYIKFYLEVLFKVIFYLLKRRFEILKFI